MHLLLEANNMDKNIQSSFHLTQADAFAAMKNAYASCAANWGVNTDDTDGDNASISDTGASVCNGDDLVYWNIREITPNDLEMAYREKERAYRLLDAEDQIQALIDECEDFETDYGFSALLIVDDEEFRLRCMYEFEHEQDCNIDENSVWRQSIEEVIREWQILGKLPPLRKEATA